MDPFWESLWEREAKFLASARPEFRHGVSFVGVSTLAEMYYCEYKVENELALGEIQTETKKNGTELHEELIPSVGIGAKEFAQLVSKKKPSYAVLRVWGAVNGLRLVGMPDHIVWSGGRPLWLVELKTTRGDPSLLWEDQAKQVMIYGLLLELMGFECSRLKLAVVRVRAQELSEEERKRWLLNVSEALMADRVREFESDYKGHLKAHIIAHHKEAAEAAIEAKLGYWKGERKAASSTSVGRCRACEYRSACPKSLVQVT